MNALAPWIHAVGWTLVHFLWQGLVVGAAFAAVRALLPRTHCRARYAAGLGALALLAAWPAATLVALLPQAEAGAVAMPLDVVAAVANTAATDPWSMLDRALPWIVTLWGVGVLVMAGRALHEWRSLSRIASCWASEQADLDAMVRNLSTRFGFLRHVRVLVSERVETPMLFGWIKPVVLLPAAVALGFPRHQIELILAHELGHLRRYDHLVNLAQTVLETLLFYHPVVHWISNEVRNERELCCDALVLRLTEGEPREYARTLASLEELRHVAGSLTLAASGGELLERVRRIIGMPAPRLASERRGSGRWLLVAFGLGAALLVAQRIERTAGQAFVAPRLAVSWLTDYRERLLPAGIPSERLELPQLSLPTPAIAPLVAAAPTSVAPVGREQAPPVASVVEPAVPPPAPPVADVVDAAPAAPTAVDPAAAARVAETVSSTRGAETVSVPVRPDPPSKPVALQAVAPAFPPFARSQRARVEATFSIAADGSVRDVRFVGDNDYAFEREAGKALRQWRFDPRSLPPNAGTARYTQVFVFAQTHSAGERDGCVLSTGSRICRDVDEASPPKSHVAGL